MLQTWKQQWVQISAHQNHNNNVNKNTISQNDVSKTKQKLDSLSICYNCNQMSCDEKQWKHPYFFLTCELFYRKSPWDSGQHRNRSNVYRYFACTGKTMSDLVLGGGGRGISQWYWDIQIIIWINTHFFFFQDWSSNRPATSNERVNHSQKTAPSMTVSWMNSMPTTSYATHSAIIQVCVCVWNFADTLAKL